ncbi:hypothetical protein O6H91_12G003400 [Diphasiastrum complanatum]|uniref:Uncharacterized protein n=5 Tax=Diphasiastrum complanatum TaxID=34168 RepID=A0ACC2BYG0_DIPCM|nr:hypothetical protein O6H91_12G003400 [Diphasiastrum complanatum]KAJ7534777.1 hypothetical protein O6H91_12G003400 [Diphasiastrum complanatum]KAJ7534778.1 hypothetical protein O6H91_12G003400 [Diphasiastrum complanatum]KAJ7534779.1 hypothetical protein O6H91_12G003400 [Diphasiastrum complanatum]KAJ7534780.1 hypothetical protein O6H91_12G003400 [Diphasiastrum complanatum]
MTCRGFLQCLLKLLNFLLILIGVAISLYALWMLNQWNNHHNQPVDPPAPAPAPVSQPLNLNPQQQVLEFHLESTSLKLHQSGRPLFLQLSIPHLQWSPFPKHLPAPWFIYSLFGFGVIVLLITCTGHIAAETSSGCCLSCYSVFLSLLILAQAAFAATIFFDHQWEEAIPDDPTGDLYRIRDFVKSHLSICKWVALAVVVVEALSLFLALILRPMVSGPQRSYDSDDDYLPSRSAVRQPLLNRQPTQGNGPSATPTDARPVRNDAWSTRMREKYGLDTTEFTYNPSDSKRFSQQNAAPAEKPKGGCVIM